MGLLDKLFRSPGQDILADGDSPGNRSVDQPAPIQETYGIPAVVPASNPGGGPATAPPGTGFPGPRGPGGAQGSAENVAESARSPNSPAPAGADNAPETLESPLRALFTESSSIDPQLESLLSRVEKVDTHELADDLRGFARAVGLNTGHERSES